VFNNLKAPRVYPDASSPELASASAKDLEFAETVSSYWVNFARTGDPNGKGLAPWPAFRASASGHTLSGVEGRAMVLGPQVQPPSAAKLELYDKLYAKQMTAVAGTR
jgi:para-nitrobenzyl esterase